MSDEPIDAEWIRGRLRSLGRTQRDLAAALGVDASAVSRILDGHRRLRDHEEAIIRAFFDPTAQPPAAPAPPNPASSEFGLG